MTVQKRSILSPSAIEPYSNPVYASAEDVHSPDPSTAGALGSESAHGDLAAYHAGCADACGEKSGGSAGFAIGGDGGSSFTGSTYNGSETGSDTSGYGRGLAGEDSFSSHGYQDSDTGSDTSGYGKGIAGEDPFSRHSSI